MHGYCVAVLYSTVDVKYFYKTSGNILPMPKKKKKNIHSGHTLLNRNHVCDASEPLCIRDFTQVG
jgi:hypothetical protein